MAQPFRFVQSSDFHLDRPVGGLAEVPDHLIDRMIDAPYAAAERVFDLAVREQADFLLLLGDILHADRAGARGLAFIGQQAERLAARGIPVYWIHGPSEQASTWPNELKLPDNIRQFPHGETQVHVHHCGDDPLATLVAHAISARNGRSSAKQKADCFAIGAIHDARARVKQGAWAIDYWAVGGCHRAVKRRFNHTLVCSSGTPQARSFAEGGTRGAIVVQVDSSNQAAARLVPTDVIRLRKLRVDARQAHTLNDVEQLLNERLRVELAVSRDVELLVTWRVEVAPEVLRRIVVETWQNELLARLRSGFGRMGDTAWSASLILTARATVRRTTQDDATLLGEFLATIEEIQAADVAPPIETLLEDARLEGKIGDMLAIADAADRLRILRDSAILARRLLGAEEAAT